MRVDELKKEIEKLIVTHENDSDLDHVIGKDNYCLYCEKYNNLVEEQKRLGIVIEKRIVKPVDSTKLKSLYEVLLEDGSKYMVYGKNLEEVAKLIKTTVSKIKKETIIQEKYWNGLFVEGDRGNLVTVKQLMTSKRSRIIASFMISENKHVRKYCYNDTPIEYLLYEKEHYELLERFVKPYEIIQTKKFKITGRVSIHTEHGSIGVSPNEVLLKITKKMIVVISEEEFLDNFSKEENYAWSMMK